MSDTEVRHSESWTLIITRNGDNWPDVTRPNGQRVYIDRIVCEMRRGARHPDVTAHGRARKKDSSVGARVGYILWAEEHDWIARLVAATRMHHDLVQVTTGVPL